MSTDSAQTARPKQRVLPWKIVVGIFLMIGAAAFGSAIAFGQPYIPVAIASTIAGFFGTVFGNRKTAALTICAVFLATLFTIVSSQLIVMLVIVSIFALLSGWELYRVGSNSTVFGIIAWILIFQPVSEGLDPTVVLGLVLLGGFAGLGLALLIGGETKVRPADVPKRYVITHSCALFIGLSLALLIAVRFETEHSHWLAMLFATRALDAPGTHLDNAKNRGLATILGAGVAGIFVLLPLTPGGWRMIGLLAMLAGLRVLPTGTWKGPAFMSAGVVLATAPTVTGVFFRMEAAAIAAFLVVAVFFAVSAVAKIIAPPKSDNA